MSTDEQRFDIECPSTQEICRSREMLLSLVLDVTVEQIELAVSPEPGRLKDKIARLLGKPSVLSSQEIQDRLTNLTNMVGESLDNTDPKICRAGVCSPLVNLAVRGINSSPKIGPIMSVKNICED